MANQKQLYILGFSSVFMVSFIEKIMTFFHSLEKLFEIEEFLSHGFSKDYEFVILVRWKESGEVSWEPYEKFVHLKSFWSFIEDNRLLDFIRNWERFTYSEQVDFVREIPYSDIKYISLIKL